jgi:hypothetical protein
LRGHAPLEILPVHAQLRGPLHFRQRGRAWIGLVRHAFFGAHHLGPEVRLHAQDVFLLLGRDLLGHGVEVVDHLERDGVAATRGMVAAAEPVIEVQIGRR